MLTQLIKSFTTAREKANEARKNAMVDNAANKWADDVAGENEGDAENAEEEAT